jgi:hypothetical protein
MPKKTEIYDLWLVAPHMTYSEVAEALETTRQYVSCACRRLGITFQKGKRGPKGPRSKNGRAS